MIKCTVCHKHVPKENGHDELKFECCLRSYLDYIKRKKKPIWESVGNGN